MRPVYWMHEGSGMMARVVKKFLKNEILAPGELTILRWYVYQWVAGMPLKPPDYERILRMDQEELKQYNFEVLVSEYAIDPF